MIKGIYGVNIAVHDLAKATENYERAFGIKSQPVGEAGFAFPGLLGSAFELNGFHLNLIASKDKNTSVARFLEQKGEGVFLLSVEVTEIDSAVERFREKGFNPLLEPSAKGLFGAVNFLHPKQLNGVQLEIYEPSV
jgi:methylmalonyl-CoA/ethylmalonyl-CoA epimerase